MSPQQERPPPRAARVPRRAATGGELAVSREGRGETQRDAGRTYTTRDPKVSMVFMVFYFEN